MRKAGYEIIIQTMRAILKRCHITKEIVLLLDFINAFNRNLLLLLTAAHVPELTKLVVWLYKNESDLMTSTGDVVTSLTGTQQGCALSSPLFARIIGYLNSRLKKEGLTTKLWYMDDGALHRTPESVAWAARAIGTLGNKTGLRLNWAKCSVHCCSSSQAEICRNLFPKSVRIHNTLDVVWLNVPMGTDIYVKKHLAEKLTHINEVIDMVSNMPHKIEATALLRSCMTVQNYAYYAHCFSRTIDTIYHCL